MAAESQTTVAMMLQSQKILVAAAKEWVC